MADPMTLALLGIGGAKAIGQIAGSASQIDRLTPEEKSRLKELERQEALGLLGLSASDEQRLLNQQLQPVRATQRQSMQQFQQSQLPETIGQGSAFRQQQALQEAQGQVMQEATQEAQMQIEQLNQIEEARQLAQIEKLNKQKQRNKEAIAGIIGGVAEGAGTAADAFVFNQQMKQFEDMLLDASKKKAAKEISKKNAGKVTSISEDYISSLMDEPSEEEQKAVQNAIQSLQGFNFSNRGQNQVPMGSTLPAQATTETSQILDNLARERAVELQSLQGFDFSNRGQNEVFMGSPLPAQATMETTEILRNLARERALQLLSEEEPSNNAIDYSDDNVRLTWGDANVIRDPRSGKVIAVKVTTPDDFERTYTPGEQGWTTIMNDLAKAGWGRGGSINAEL